MRVDAKVGAEKQNRAPTCRLQVGQGWNSLLAPYLYLCAPSFRRAPLLLDDRLRRVLCGRIRTSSATLRRTQARRFCSKTTHISLWQPPAHPAAPPVAVAWATKGALQGHLPARASGRLGQLIRIGVLY